jgi:hypothetical protein
VLARLSEKGITVSPKKCSFGVQEVEFLGHTINADGVHFSREKLDHVLNIPPPSTAKQLKSFLGVTVYFHDHVLNYSDMVRPLHRMLSSYQPRKILRWTDSTRDAFEKVKAAINACPQLYFIDDTSPIFVNTDASDYGIGAMCYQVVTDPITAELVFGRTITLDRQLFVAPEEFQSHGEAELSIKHWADRMIATQNIILEEAIREQYRRDEAFLSKPVTGKHQISFKKGAYVLLDYPTMESRVSHRGPPNKFLPFLKGPFKVMSKDMDIYGVQCLITDATDQVHVSRLRPFIATHTGVDDDKIRKIAMWDYLHDYPVDHVVDHDGEPSARRKLLFRIRWKTFGPERDSWIPYAALRENEFLHSYLLRLGTTAWTSLIPLKFHEQYNLVRTPGRRGTKPRTDNNTLP